MTNYEYPPGSIQIGPFRDPFIPATSEQLRLKAENIQMEHKRIFEKKDAGIGPPIGLQKWRQFANLIPEEMRQAYFFTACGEYPQNPHTNYVFDCLATFYAILGLRVAQNFDPNEEKKFTDHETDITIIAGKAAYEEQLIERYDLCSVHELMYRTANAGIFSARNKGREIVQSHTPA